MIVLRAFHCGHCTAICIMHWIRCRTRRKHAMAKLGLQFGLNETVICTLTCPSLMRAQRLCLAIIVKIFGMLMMSRHGPLSQGIGDLGPVRPILAMTHYILIWDHHRTWCGPPLSQFVCMTIRLRIQLTSLLFPSSCVYLLSHHIFTPFSLIWIATGKRGRTVVLAHPLVALIRVTLRGRQLSPTTTAVSHLWAPYKKPYRSQTNLPRTYHPCADSQPIYPFVAHRTTIRAHKTNPHLIALVGTEITRVVSAWHQVCFHVRTARSGFQRPGQFQGMWLYVSLIPNQEDDASISFYILVGSSPFAPYFLSLTLLTSYSYSYLVTTLVLPQP